MVILLSLTSELKDNGLKYTWILCKENMSNTFRETSHCDVMTENKTNDPRNIFPIIGKVWHLFFTYSLVNNERESALKSSVSHERDFFFFSPFVTLMSSNFPSYSTSPHHWPSYVIFFVSSSIKNPYSTLFVQYTYLLYFLCRCLIHLSNILSKSLFEMSHWFTQS